MDANLLEQAQTELDHISNTLAASAVFIQDLRDTNTLLRTRGDDHKADANWLRKENASLRAVINGQSVNIGELTISNSRLIYALYNARTR